MLKRNKPEVLLSLNSLSKLFYSVVVGWQVKQVFVETMSSIRKSNCIHFLLHMVKFFVDVYYRQPDDLFLKICKREHSFWR